MRYGDASGRAVGTQAQCGRRQTRSRRALTPVLTSARRPIAVTAALAAAALMLACHLNLTWNAPLEFDEAYNLQMPLNLYLSGQYQTWYEDPRPFAHQITTGPTVLLPVAGL